MSHQERCGGGGCGCDSRDGRRAYRVRGLDCAEEVDALRKALARVPGAGEPQFDLLNGTMSVAVHEGGIGDAEIVAAVRSAGLEAVPWDRSSGLPPESGDGFWARRGRAVLCAASGACLAGGLAAQMAAGRSLLELIAAAETAGRTGLPLWSAVAYAGAIVAGAWHVLPKAWAALRNRRADMNLLMTIAVVGAVAIGQWFEAAAVSFLFGLALLLESWSVGRARHAIRALLDITPPQAEYRCADDGCIVTRAVADVPVGAVCLVRPGARVPLDGVVTSGGTAVNQAPITGESVPVPKAAGDPVFAGTINGEGAFEFRTTKPAADTVLARIIRMVEEVQSRRAPTEQWVERFARYYTPAMILLALAVAVGLPLALGGGWGHWLYQSLVMLVIACPCALVISTPVSIVAGITSAARAGVLVKGGYYLEAPAGLAAVAMDKTGTLTAGRPVVTQIVPLSGHTEREVLERAAALEARSEHPLAAAIRRRAEADGVRVEPATDFRAVPGKGAEAVLGGRRFWIGSHRLMVEKQAGGPDVQRAVDALEDAGHSVMVVGNDEHVCGFIAMADTLRPEARAVVARLRRLGVRRVVMLTGDNEGTARAVAEAAGVDEVRFELLPEDKVQAIRELAERHGPVAMVGDGVNDAPAMAAAGVAVAMGAMGSDAAIETADVALMADDLSRLPWLIVHSRRTLRVIRQNVGFALAVKAVFMALAVSGAATLWMAIAADMGASLLVILNGLRLLNGGDRGAA